jgi:hypothetical protein
MYFSSSQSSLEESIKYKINSASFKVEVASLFIFVLKFFKDL